ncbi:hypothetical protein, partial [Achromobacter ruhlandii]|uniref:hypothetical protein n=1 Tax=Achromobacter ruhlandii TaxID=72557 RepID=UPI0023689C8D
MKFNFINEITLEEFQRPNKTGILSIYPIFLLTPELSNKLRGAKIWKIIFINEISALAHAARFTGRHTASRRRNILQDHLGAALGHHHHRRLGIARHH